MESLHLNLSMACNNRCVFCNCGGLDAGACRWMPVETALSEIRLFREQGGSSLGFFGGEPTLYPHLFDCVARARELGYERICVESNGTRFEEAGWAEGLLAAGATEVSLSIHSHDPAIEDALTGVPGNLDAKLRGLHALMESGAARRLRHGLALNPLICGRTLPHLADYVRFYKRLGVERMRFDYIWPQHLALRDRAMVPSFREAVPALVRLMLLNETDFKVRLTFSGVPPCMLRWSSPALPEAVARHLAARYLDESRTSLRVVTPQGDRFRWEDWKDRSLKVRIPACGECAYGDRCDGVWKTYAALYGLEELSPVAAAGGPAKP